MNIILPRLHMRIERWKWNQELEMYVSTFGNFKDKNKQPLKIMVTQKGYVKVRNGNKVYSVHRAVLMTWKPLRNYTDMTVDHLNHNKRDNNIHNLEWVTREENIRRATLDHLNRDAEDENNGYKYVSNLKDVSKWLQAQMDTPTGLTTISQRVLNVLNTNKKYCNYTFTENNNLIYVK